jgi:isopropylmalate/homocitrate/citramalate synthase
VEQPSNRAVTGRRLFHVESGIIANWVSNVWDVDRTEAVPYLPELVGQSGPEIVLGKGSGLDNVDHWLDRLGLTAGEARRIDIPQQVKQFGLEYKRRLTDEEFAGIVRRVGSSAD